MHVVLPDHQLSTLAPEDTIYYYLSPDDLPHDPEKEWSGVVTMVYPRIRTVMVRVLNEGFEGEAEEVGFNQIIRVERANGESEH